jgi:hypothetical protein
MIKQASDRRAKDYAMNASCATRPAEVNRTGNLPFKHLALTVFAAGILCGIPWVALESSSPITAIGSQLHAVVDEIGNGDMNAAGDLNAILYNTAQVDIEAGSMFRDATLQYLLMQQTQRHLVRASEAFDKENYMEAATEMRKASSYMRLEAANATGEGREELHTTLTKLDQLATAVQ